MAKFKVSVGVGTHFEEDEIEIPDSELVGLSEEDREKVLDEYWRDFANNYIDGGITEIED